MENDPINHNDPTGMMLSDIGVYQTENPEAARLVERAEDQGVKNWIAGQRNVILDGPQPYFSPVATGSSSGTETAAVDVADASLGAPQKPAPQGNSSLFDDAHKDCLSELGTASAPGLMQAASVIQISQTTGVDPSLFSITWYEESRFSYTPKNGPHGDGTADIGPGQLSPRYWDKAPYTSGLRNPFGTNREVGQVFNGNPVENLLLTAYALNSLPGSRANKAGLYKAGSTTGPGYQGRVSRFNNQVKSYDAFYSCLAQRGFRAP